MAGEYLYFYNILVGNKNATRPYTYSSNQPLAIFQIVRIPFGTRSALGFVLDLAESNDSIKIKSIIEAFDYLLESNFVSFLEQFADYNFVSIGSAIELALPNACFANPPLPLIFEKDNAWVTLDQLKGMKSNTIIKLPIFEGKYIEKELFKLDEDQIDAVERLKKNTSVTLLEGVTGSGKTIVALESLSNLNGKVLIITPEISLGRSWANTIKARFGAPTFFYHHKISPIYKSSFFKWINSEDSGFIVAARSALLLPYKNLSAIIIDEEHSLSLKQDVYPRYHARDMAILRCSIQKIKCLLMSATPSLESCYNYQRNKYDYVKLRRQPRFGTPQLQVIKQERLEILACDIIKEIELCFSRNEQVLLFLNRKGYAPSCVCSNCWCNIRCVGCEVPKIFYSDHSIICHKCGNKDSLPTICPMCKTTTIWRKYGVGIEKLEEYVKNLFPSKAWASICSDTKDIDGLIGELNIGKIDGLIATQVLAQGHDFKRIALVVIVDADTGLNSPDFRIQEKMLQLWKQIRGRSGRHDLMGKIIIQTNDENNKFIQLFNEEDYVSKLMLERKEENWPPFSRCAALIFSAKQKNIALNYFSSSTFNALRSNSEFEIYGPLYFGRYKFIYEWRFLIKINRNKKFNKIIQEIINSLHKEKGLTFDIEIDPYSFI